MLDVIDHGEVRELRLNRPPVNALNFELIEALTNAIEQAGGHRVSLYFQASPECSVPVWMCRHYSS